MYPNGVGLIFGKDLNYQTTLANQGSFLQNLDFRASKEAPLFNTQHSHHGQHPSNGATGNSSHKYHFHHRTPSPNVNSR